MATETAAQSRTSFDLKSASLPVVAVVLKTTDAAQFAVDLAERVADAPGFFDFDPVLIDLAPVREAEEPIDFAAIAEQLRQQRTLPVAVRGGSPAQMEAAREMLVCRAAASKASKSAIGGKKVLRNMAVRHWG